MTRTIRANDRNPNKSLQATAATPYVFDGVGDSLLPSFVGAQSPAAVPELGSLGP